MVQFYYYFSYNPKMWICNFRAYIRFVLVVKYKRWGLSYQEEGFSHIYMACTSANTQRLIDLFENMFGDLDEPDLEESETDTMKGLPEQVADAEKADVEVTEGPIPAGGVTRVVITSLPVPIEFGLQPEMYPKTNPVKELSKKDPTKKVTRFYYACHKCLHSSQNKPSMYTHITDALILN